MITRVSAKNFKSIKNIDVELGPITLFVGPNGSGKSTFIDVLRFFRDSVRGGFTQAVNKRGLGGVLDKKSNTRNIKMIIECKAEHYAGMYHIEMKKSKDGELILTRELLEVEYSEQDKKNKKWKSVELDIKNGKIIKFPEGFAPEHDPRNLMLPLINSLPGFNCIYKELSQPKYYTIRADQMRLPQRLSSPHLLDEKGSNFSSVLMEMQKNKTDSLDELLDALNLVVPTITGLKIINTGGFLTVRLCHQHPTMTKSGKIKKSPPRYYDLEHESDGTIRVLGILLALHQPHQPTMTVIEEPERTVHPGALGMLAEHLREAGENRNQILLTTHSPELLNWFDDSEIRAVEMIEGYTRIGPLAEHQRDAIRDKLFLPGEILRMEGLQLDTE